jgi:DNA invertase Pin-like site-specific DNA recombinase
MGVEEYLSDNWREGGAMHVALSARVSTADKDQNPETQLRPLREHLAALPDVADAGAFVDHASADNLRGRKEWRRLLELARRREVDLIVVWKLDRAFRSVLDGANTLQTLTACGCGLRSLQEPWIDTTTAIGEALYHITLAWAQLEKRQHPQAGPRERVKAGMDRARAEGAHVGRPKRTTSVTAHPSWPKVLAGIQARHLTQTEAAKKLRVRRATLAAALAGVPKGGAENGALAVPTDALS